MQPRPAMKRSRRWRIRSGPPTTVHRRVRFRAGELAVLDYADPLALAVLPDLVAEEPREYFYVLVLRPDRGRLVASVHRDPAGRDS